MAETRTHVGIINENIISSYDVKEPQVSTLLHRRYGLQYEPLFRKFEAMGRLFQNPDSKWYGYEDMPYTRTVVVGTVTNQATSAGDYVEFTIKGTDTGGSPNYEHYPRVGEVIFSPNDMTVSYRISSVTGTGTSTITVKAYPVASTDYFGSLSADDEIIIGGMAKGYQTNLPPGRRTGQVKRTHSVQLFKDASGLSNDQYAQAKWFKVYEGGLERWMTDGTALAEYYLSRGMDMQFTMGKMNANTDNVTEAYYDINGTATSETGAVPLSKGFIPEIVSMGFTPTYTYSSGFDIDDDLFNIEMYMRGQYVISPVVWMPVGAKAGHKINLAAKEYFVDDTGANLTNSIVKDARYQTKEMSASINFRYILFNNVTYVFDVQDTWSDPSGFGAYDLDKNYCAIPMTQMKDGVTGKKLNNFEVAYRGMGGYSRKFDAFKIDGKTTSGVDRTDFGVMSEMGLGVYAVNQMVYGKAEAE